jgi:transposase, IS30 family
MNREGFEHLNERERERIAIGFARGESCRAIWQTLGRPASMVSWERRRNGGKHEYVGCEAQQLARQRAQRARRPCKLRPVVDNWLRGMVLTQLRRRRSPEQIAADLKRSYPLEPERWVSHQTIYTSIRILPRGELKRELASLLRRKGKPRQGSAEAAAPREWIHQRIHDRPMEVEDRTIPGNFEGDLLIGKAKSPAAVGVLLERTSRRLWLAKLERRDAYSAYEAFAKKLKTIEPHLHKTLTYDQGSEMAEHERLTKKLDIQVYFCDPRSPWQRAGCENTNGLLRDYLPKGMDFADVTQAELNYIAFEMNERPRKTLNWATPNEVWRKLLQGKSFEEAVAIGA